MTSTTRRRASAPREGKTSRQPHDDAVPVVPGWLRNGGVLALILGAIAALAIGFHDGAAWGWTLILAVIAGAAMIWWWDYRRRLRARAELRDRELYELSELTIVDQMRGHPDFELYCAEILQRMHYTYVECIGRGGDGGMDILAIDPDGNSTGVQCKRRTGTVGPDVFRDMAGAVAAGRHAGRRPVLMTNARVTDDGWAAAEERGIEIIDRTRLGRAMWELRNAVRTTSAVPGEEHDDGTLEDRPTGSETVLPQRLTPDARITVSAVTFAMVAVIVVFVHAATTGPRQAPTATPRVNVRTSAAASASVAAGVSRPTPWPNPAVVVREYFAAISRRDWQQVWDLGGKNLGRGPYASYRGMISAYQGAIRDVLTEIAVSGDSVTGQFLAYQTGNVIQPYRFEVTVHDGVIVSGYQHED
jgi:restriction system protein